MLSIIISTIVFFVAAWYFNRYLDEQGIPKGMTRGVLVFTLAALVSWGSGALAEWAQVKLEGPQTAAATSGDLSQFPKAANPLPRPVESTAHSGLNLEIQKAGLSPAP